MTKLSSLLSEIEKLFEKLPTYIIELGVFSMDSQRKQTVKVGITNAELMFIHENGSPLHNLPARPVLQMTIDYANKHLLQQTIDRCVELYLLSFDEASIETELDKLCLKMEKYARKIIYSNDGRLAPNSPSTIAQKGDNHPLFDTGQLARSITCKLVKV